MARRRLNLLTLLSLLLFVAAAVLWVRSYLIDDHVGRHRVHVGRDARVTEHRSGLFSSNGRIAWATGTFVDSASNIPPETLNIPAERRSRSGVFSGDFGWWHSERDEDFTLGFGHNSDGTIYPAPQWSDEHWRVVSLPHALAAALFLVAPLCHLGVCRFGWTRKEFALGLVAGWIALTACAVIGVALMPVGGAVVGMLAAGAAVIAVGTALKRYTDARSATRRGLCHSCGYDLRATPNRCPECGTEPFKMPA